MFPLIIKMMHSGFDIILRFKLCLLLLKHHLKQDWYHHTSFSYHQQHLPLFILGFESMLSNLFKWSVASYSNVAAAHPPPNFLILQTSGFEMYRKSFLVDRLFFLKLLSRFADQYSSDSANSICYIGTDCNAGCTCTFHICRDQLDQMVYFCAVNSAIWGNLRQSIPHKKFAVQNNSWRSAWSIWEVWTKYGNTHEMRGTAYMVYEDNLRWKTFAINLLFYSFHISGIVISVCVKPLTFPFWPLLLSTSTPGSM